MRLRLLIKKMNKEISMEVLEQEGVVCDYYKQNDDELTISSVTCPALESDTLFLRGGNTDLNRSVVKKSFINNHDRDLYYRKMLAGLQGFKVKNASKREANLETEELSTTIQTYASDGVVRLKLQIKKSADRLCLTILEQDNESRGNKQFIANNDFCIYSESHPAISNNSIYLRGSTLDKDDDEVVRWFDDDCEMTEWLNDMTEALMEWASADVFGDNTEEVIFTIH